MSSAISISDCLVQVKPCAVGTPASRMTPLAKSFEPSSCAAAFEGPNTAKPALRNTSATPLTSGTSGPMTTKSTANFFASSQMASLSVTATG